ncbi:MAG TPA: PAS domain S-box protein, partial [Propionibacteriaceae bacterium]
MTRAPITPSAAEERYRLLVESVRDYAIFLLDSTGHVITWNAGAEHIKGYRAEEILGRHFSVFYPSEDVEAGKPEWELVEAARDGRLEDEGWRVRKDGTLLWANVVITALYDDTHQLRGFGKVVRDMTERRAAEQRLRVNEERFRLLVEGVRDYAILGLDVGGHITSWNTGAEHIKGYRAEEILGQHFSVFYPPEDVEAGKPEWELVEATREGRLEDEGWRVRKDGTRFWANVVITALYDDTHQLRGYGKVTRDMTERRAAEQELRASQDRLRHSGASLVALNEALRRQADELSRARDRAEQAVRDAEAATRAKSAFLATMSHEIRTPMNAVIGMTGFLLETSLSDDQRSYVETVRDSGDALLMIINDILDFSKIESGHLDLEANPFDLRDCVENAVALVAHVADDQGLELVTLLSSDCPRLVVGDVTRFRQVIVNLLANAVKFTPSGEVAVTVDAEQLTEHLDGPYLLNVSVRDTGGGIAADRLSKLFEPFTQADSSDTRIYGGTGLGLAISRRLAQAMKGDLAVVSELGTGSTFTFTAVLAGAVDQPSDASSGSAAPLAGRRVLVVDDNAASREMLGSLLSGWGMSCAHASHAAEALRLLVGGADFDAVLVDLEMPGMDGLQLAARIRGLPTQLPLILMTGLHSSAEAVQRHLVDATVTKPIRSGALLVKLLTILAPDQLPATVAATAGGRGSEESIPPAPLQILLAEDNVVNQRVAQLMLSRLGHAVDTVDNGRDALAAVQSRHYDVVLMDLQMPQMGGLEATRRIRAELTADSQPRII